MNRRSFLFTPLALAAPAAIASVPRLPPDTGEFIARSAEAHEAVMANLRALRDLQVRRSAAYEVAGTWTTPNEARRREGLA